MRILVCLIFCLLLCGCRDRELEDRVVELEAYRNFSNASMVKCDKQFKELSDRIKVLEEARKVPGWKEPAKPKEVWSRVGR